ncbi:MAG TPA: hypothetical protein VMV92_21895 [Streptosporangiaceae bacterium]|nr:hypothetical protein [Streptosporangiaceae bacterium]
MAGTAQPRRHGRKSWLKSFSGILASAATIVAAVASVVAAHQTSRVNQLTIVVRQQRQQLQRAAPAATEQSGSVGGATLSGGTYLSALQPTVDHADLQTGTQTMSAKTYPNSITFGCDGPANTDQPDEAFNVGGHALFRAVVGIPDNAQNATSLNETVTFANQGGTQLISPVVVSLGKPATVRLSISRVTQLEVTCSGTDPRTQQPDSSNELTLGNAYISG